MRNWTEANNKIIHEKFCRVCGIGRPDPAHIIPRSQIPGDDVMDGRNIVPLCRQHHSEYDQHKLELLPYLTREEQAFAVSLAGMESAYRRVTVG